MQKKNYQYILKSKKNGKKLFAVLIDPDKFESTDVISKANRAGVDFIMVGGSILSDGSFEKCIQIIKKRTKIPVIIFPGNHLQISKNADGILLLSLISGRNPELLIGKQVIAAPLLKASQLELLPTGYMLIESGKQTSASYMSNTTPIPADKTNIAACTAMAGEQLGLQLIYMDAGSGAIQTVSEEMIKKVSKSISIPLIVGGGIDSPKKALLACKSGADVIVVGNAIEKNIDLLESIAKTIHTYKK
ncbi:MAG: geranylgeranylglyceryl/heptaprenylglyceryl phosphate synthase [Bacteroidetes bacterium]|nr:geranylgeranylglyceryl/heptaprenylglyceryl phosphate synthase [Bacteroidota bacterium]